MPSVVVVLLQTLDDFGLGRHFAVVGTHALYAYEAAAGVRIVPGALATQDVDLLWDARHRVQFVIDIERLDTSMLRVLQRVDPTFRRKELHNETAINDRGFEVDFLRRVPVDGDPHPDAPRFEHVVVSAAGKMALMRTVAPTTFVAFKRWMAESAAHRPQPKRRRDLRQADIVQTLLDEGLLVPGH